MREIRDYIETNWHDLDTLVETILDYITTRNVHGFVVRLPEYCDR